MELMNMAFMNQSKKKQIEPAVKALLLSGDFGHAHFCLPALMLANGPSSPGRVLNPKGLLYLLALLCQGLLGSRGQVKSEGTEWKANTTETVGARFSPLGVGD